MSQLPADDPILGDARSCEAIEKVIVPRSHDLGGFQVRRALPAIGQRMVGPFIFFDQMGPAEFHLGEGLDVRPHPHIGLSTVTYLFDGEIMHRDSLGSALAIRPGEVNLMTAGRGIVHSERTGLERRADGQNLFGIQAWMALPKSHEETAPAFAHHAVDELPRFEGEGKRVRLVVGSLYGQFLTDYSAKNCQPKGKAPIELVNFDDAASPNQAVIAGRVDAAFRDFTANAYVAQQSNGALKVVGGVVASSPYGVAVSKDRPDLAKAINLAMNDLIQDGEYVAILKKWNVAEAALTKSELIQATG